DLKGCIIAGKMAAQADCDAAAADKTKSSCAVTKADNASVAAGTLASILSVGSIENSGPRNSITISLGLKSEGDGDRAASIKCALADANSKDAALANND